MRCVYGRYQLVSIGTQIVQFFVQAVFTAAYFFVAFHQFFLFFFRRGVVHFLFQGLYGFFFTFLAACFRKAELTIFFDVGSDGEILKSDSGFFFAGGFGYKGCARTSYWLWEPWSPFLFVLK
jgi:hypothetical protein